MRNARLDEAQAGIKITRRNINNRRYAGDNDPNGRKNTGTKEYFDEGEEESGKTGLKLNSQNTKVIASSPIISLTNRWGKSGNSGRFYFLGL